MGDPKDTARALIAVVDNGKLAQLWKSTPVTLGGPMLGLSFGNRDMAEAYVLAAGVWLDEANRAMAELDEKDPDPVIDELGDRITKTATRRTLLISMGLGRRSADEEGIHAFFVAAVDEIKAAVRFVKENAPDPKKFTIGVGVILALVVLILLLK